MSADARRARNTRHRRRRNNRSEHGPTPQSPPPPPRGVGATVPDFATALATRFRWGGCRRRKPVVRGTRKFRSKKEGERRERKNKNKTKITTKAQTIHPEMWTKTRRFMPPHVIRWWRVLAERKNIKTTAQLHLDVLFWFFIFANPTKIRCCYFPD